MKWLQSPPYLTLMGSGFMSCLGGGVAGFFSKQKPALLCSVDIRGEIYIIKEEKLYSWHYMCLSLHPETLPNEPHTPVLSLTTMCPFLLWGYASCGPWTPELSAQGLAIYHPLSWQVCNRVSRELGSLGLSLKKSDLRSMTAPDPGDKCVGVTDKQQIRESTARFSHH